jgi:hypothetical protein
MYGSISLGAAVVALATLAGSDDTADHSAEPNAPRRCVVLATTSAGDPPVLSLVDAVAAAADAGKPVRLALAASSATPPSSLTNACTAACLASTGCERERRA